MKYTEIEDVPLHKVQMFYAVERQFICFFKKNFTIHINHCTDEDKLFLINLIDGIMTFDIPPLHIGIFENPSAASTPFFLPRNPLESGVFGGLKLEGLRSHDVAYQNLDFPEKIAVGNVHRKLNHVVIAILFAFYSLVLLEVYGDNVSIEEMCLVMNMRSDSDSVRIIKEIFYEIAWGDDPLFAEVRGRMLMPDRYKDKGTNGSLMIPPSKETKGSL